MYVCISRVEGRCYNIGPLQAQYVGHAAPLPSVPCAVWRCLQPASFFCRSLGSAAVGWCVLQRISVSLWNTAQKRRNEYKHHKPSSISINQHFYIGLSGTGTARTAKKSYWGKSGERKTKQVQFKLLFKYRQRSSSAAAAAFLTWPK